MSIQICFHHYPCGRIAFCALFVSMCVWKIELIVDEKRWVDFTYYIAYRRVYSVGDFSFYGCFSCMGTA